MPLNKETNQQQEKLHFFISIDNKRQGKHLSCFQENVSFKSLKNEWSSDLNSARYTWQQHTSFRCRSVSIADLRILPRFYLLINIWISKQNQKNFKILAKEFHIEITDETKAVAFLRVNGLLNTVIISTGVWWEKKNSDDLFLTFSVIRSINR